MRKAAGQFADRLAATDIQQMRVPVLHNVGIDGVSDTRAALVQQLFSPVPWTKIVQTMAASGVTRLIECGPGKVLCGLTRRIDKSLQAYPIDTPETLQAAVEELDSA
jgi:[acyl-carrier-protein] S-malonyltransferase